MTAQVSQFGLDKLQDILAMAVRDRDSIQGQVNLLTVQVEEIIGQISDLQTIIADCEVVSPPPGP